MRLQIRFNHLNWVHCKIWFIETKLDGEREETPACEVDECMLTHVLDE